MKVLIGITQDLDAARSDLAKKFKKLGTSTEVGPFRTKEEAESWKSFMMNRRENYEDISAPVAPGKNTLWFGFTVESPVLQ